jgi:hypothetical protein
MARNPVTAGSFAIVLLALLALGATASPVSDLKRDEVLVFYPSYLAWDKAAGQWSGSIHGNVHEPAEGVVLDTTLATLRLLLGLSGELTDQEKERFRERTAAFAADNERRKSIVVTIDGKTFASAPSRANGHFLIDVTLPEGAAGTALPFSARLLPDDRRTFGGEVRLLAAKGISVVSDVDDTIRVSNVLDRSELMANTFVRPYQVVEGMPELYAAWGRQGVAVHYVTGSPWQIFPALWEFLNDGGFPAAGIDMRYLRVLDGSFKNLFREGLEYKPEPIREILRRFPGRRFVLVGDSGEHDAEVYAAACREFPEQVRGIFIRAVLEEHLDRARYTEIFAGIDDSSWIIFRDPAALPRDLAAWIDPEGH